MDIFSLSTVLEKKLYMGIDFCYYTFEEKTWAILKE
jgi:hypothetical protein